MKEIRLTQGLVALVDDEDFDALNQHNWHAHKHGRTFYAMRNVRTGLARPKQRQLRMHAVIMGTPNGQDTDHIDGNGLNNCRDNLRVVSHIQNQRNQQKKALGCTSRYRGVSRSKSKRCWIARIQDNRRSVFLGLFDCEFEAAAAYDVAGFARDPEHFTPNFSASFLAPSVAGGAGGIL